MDLPQGSIVAIYAAGLNNTQPSLATGAIPTAAASLEFAVQFSIPLLRRHTPDAEITYDGAAPGSVAGVAQINFGIPASPIHGLTSL